MPPRVMEASQAGVGFGKWYGDLPPMIRIYGTALVATTGAFALGLLNPMLLALLWPRVLRKFEIWRLITNFTFLGKFSFNFVIRILWLITYGVPLEQQVYQFEPADFLFMVISLVAMILVASYPLQMVFCGPSLIHALIYIWSRNFPDQQVSLYGLVKIQSFYLPFAFMAITLAFGNSIIPDLVGIVAGHIYYFLWDIYPRQSGVRVLKTPQFLKSWLRAWGVGQPAQAPPAGTADAGFQAFRGTGRRLGSQ